MSYIGLKFSSASKNTKITLKANALIDNSDSLIQGSILRTLTRATYINSNEKSRLEVGQGTFIITDPKVELKINNDDKYTTNDLIQKNIQVIVPDTSLQNYIRFRYFDVNSSKEYSEWRKIDDFEFIEPEYLIRGNIDGEKTICAQVKDEKDVISKESCDSIILDNIAPKGSIIINNGDSETESREVVINIEEDTDNIDDPVFYSFSLNAVDWSNWTEMENEIEFNSFLLNNVGVASAFVRFKDTAVNISRAYSDSIRIKNNNPGDNQLPTYSAEFSDYEPILNSNAPSIYTLSNIPSSLYSNYELGLVFNVKNTGTLVWYPEGEIDNPVNISYHWQYADGPKTGQYYTWNGNRSLLRHSVQNNETHINTSLFLQTPREPGNFNLIIEPVHEGVTWFSNQGNIPFTKNIQIEFFEDEEKQEGVPGYEREDDFGHGQNPGNVSSENSFNYKTIECSTNRSTILRIAPNNDSAIINFIGEGDIVTAFGQSNSWLQVKTGDNKIGWIETINLVCEGDVSELPVIHTENLYREKAFICDTRFVALRTGPSWDSTVNKIIRLNNEIYVLQEIPEEKGGTWLQIMMKDGSAGWILDSFVCVTKDGQVYNWIDYINFERPYEDPSKTPEGEDYDVPITSDFGERNGEYHTGVDYGLYCNTEIFSAAKGIV